MGSSAAALASRGQSVLVAHRRGAAAWGVPQAPAWVVARGAAWGVADGAAVVLGATRALRPWCAVPNLSLATAEARRGGTARSFWTSATRRPAGVSALTVLRRRPGSGATGSTGGPGRPLIARMAPTRAVTATGAAAGATAGATGRGAPMRGVSSTHSVEGSKDLWRRGGKMVVNAV